MPHAEGVTQRSPGSRHQPRTLGNRDSYPPLPRRGYTMGGAQLCNAFGVNARDCDRIPGCAGGPATLGSDVPPLRGKERIRWGRQPTPTQQTQMARKRTADVGIGGRSRESGIGGRGSGVRGRASRIQRIQQRDAIIGMGCASIDMDGRAENRAGG